MARGITQEDVWTACDALLLAGARPTIERVRQHIGRGSPNTVSPYLDAWFKRLGGRIQDPVAFAAPPELPDPIQQAARHLWELALSETRRDFDKRLQDGMAEAVANVEAEKEKAAHANAAAFDAVAKVSRLQAKLDEQHHLVEQAGQDLAAERARLHEVHASLAKVHAHLRQQDDRAAAELDKLRQQLASALERADAADRRVAMELERERTARARAERDAVALRKSIDAMRDKTEAAELQARRQLDAAHELGAALNAQIATTSAELMLEKQRVGDLRAASELSAAEAVAARSQVASLQASLDRLAALVERGIPHDSKAARNRRGGKPSPAVGA